MATIKAGTYRFNDTLTAPVSYLAEVINFICGTTNHIGITVLTGDKLTVAYGNSGGTATNVYENGWLSDGYQSITVIKDTTVNDDNVAAWIEANSTYVESGENIPPITEVTYKGTTVMIEAGKTITLHTAGKRLTEDLVIKANEYEDKESILTEKTVNANGTYTARDEGADGYSRVVVNVSVPEAPEVTSEEKTVIPTKSTQTVTPTNADYISKVTVNPIPDNYIQPSGSITIVANGTYDVTEKASVTVNVESSGGDTYEKYNGEVVIS